jgi:hypothetical protein
LSVGCFLGKFRSPNAIFNRLISFVTATICRWIARFSVRGASFSFSSNVANKSLSASRAMNNSGKYEVFCILTNWGKGGIREWNHPRPSNRCCQSVSGSANSAASWTCMVFGSSWTQKLDPSSSIKLAGTALSPSVCLALARISDYRCIPSAFFLRRRRV